MNSMRPCRKTSRSNRDVTCCHSPPVRNVCAPKNRWEMRPSASAVAHGRYPAAAYNLFSIEREGAAWRCEQTVRGVDDALRVRQIRQTRLF